MDQQFKSNITSGKQWLRLLYMLFVALCLYLAGIVMWFVASILVLLTIITGAPNTNLRNFGQSLSKYFYQAFLFLTYNTEEKPYPFSDWPIADDVYDDDALEGEIEVASPDDTEEKK